MSAIVSPALSCASRVLAPRCGVATTPSSSNSGDDVVGSVSNTSSAAAPAITPSRTQSARSDSTTMPPRVTLMSRSVGLALTSRSRSMRPVVSFVFGRWMVRKSDSPPPGRAATARPPSGVPGRTTRTGRRPRAASRTPWRGPATSLPMRPRPTMPSVLSASSTPSHRLRSQRPARARRGPAARCGPGRAAAPSCARPPRRCCSGRVDHHHAAASGAASTSMLSRPIARSADHHQVGRPRPAPRR